MTQRTNYRARLYKLSYLIALALAFAGVTAARVAAQASPSTAACQNRVNNTAQKLLECIQPVPLWQHLVDFQTIADENPDANGHGNRDTGTSGYRASVSYVANLMRQAGYHVAIQTYVIAMPTVAGVPDFVLGGRHYAVQADWQLARLTGPGVVSAPLQAANGDGHGCVSSDFSGFRRGSIAVLRRGGCAYDVQVEQAEAAGASAVILRDPAAATQGVPASAPAPRTAFRIRLTHPASIPVVSIVSGAMNQDLERRLAAGDASPARLEVHTQSNSVTDYNVIADSPFGDPAHKVVVDAHLDAIYGAGILDNASGSATTLEIAQNLASTPTRNQLRYIWFGGEELGLFGSAYYTTHLSATERNQIAFDIDVDVTATPNYDYLVADPRFASNVKQFPPDVVPRSGIGNQMFFDYFQSQNVPALSATFGNDGTDSNSFSLVGIPNTGILTNQDCCKTPPEVAIWGGSLGNYEGHIPSFDGGCVDNPGVYCDNLSNNDPVVLEEASKAAAYAVLGMANYKFPSEGR